MINHKRCLITGGLGFIGSYLTERLLDRGLETIIIDNKLTNVVNEDFFEKSNCKVFTQSIKDFDLDNLKDIDVVFHLASILGPSGILDYAGDIAVQTINDVIKLRDYCIKNEILMIDISTSEVYGHKGVLKEDSQKVFSGDSKVRSEYGIGKLASEIALINKAKIDSRLKYNLIRPFNVTGPRQKPDAGFVLPRFVISALTDQPITVFGDGTQRRAFTHVKDICNSILAIYDSDYQNEIWNVGRPKNEMNINEMADKIIDLTKTKFPGINPKKVYVNPKKIHGPLFEETADKVPYIKKITKFIGWKSQISSEQIFSEVLDFYKEKIDNGYFFKTS